LNNATPHIKETPVPQWFLSSQYNAHHKAFKTADNSAGGKKRVSRTLSRKFWQQKYFLEKLVLARSALAPENFSERFCESDSQINSTSREVSVGGAAMPRHSSRMENRKRNDRKTHGSNVPIARHPRVNDVQMPSLVFSRSFTACGFTLPPDDFIT
jgi:hypothetical protein